MNRLALAVLGGAAAALGLWLLQPFMLSQGWASFDPASGNWSLVAQSWELLRYTWPVLLLGLAVGVVAAWPAGVWAGGHAEIAQQRSLDEAWLADEESRLAAREAHLQAQLNAATAAQAAAEQQAQDARQRIAEAEASVREAHQQRLSATGYAESRRKQLARLRKKTSGLVSVEQVFLTCRELAAEDIPPTLEAVSERLSEKA